MGQNQTKVVETARVYRDFHAPVDGMIDLPLSTDQKQKVLDSMEQVAWQLLNAAADSVTGREMTILREVRGAPAVHRVVLAYDIVVKDLRSTLRSDMGDAERADLENALNAIERITALKTGPRIVSDDSIEPPEL